MNNVVLDKQEGAMRQMFNGIAPNYDKLNHILSLNIDRLWRNRMVKFLAKETKNIPSRVLDVACGTGDSSIALYKGGMEVIGADISEKMLEVAAAKTVKAGKKGKRTVPLPKYVAAKAGELPFDGDTFDAVAISFGIRNIHNRQSCLAGMHRVLRKGGVVAILELSKPRNRIVRFLYDMYFNNIPPLLGNLVAKEKKAYSYLPASVEAFPPPDDFAEEIRDAGFRNVEYRKFTFGICVLYTGVKL